MSDARMLRVSAVIPTRNRPDLVLRAVRSALAQTVRDYEVIVVLDGPDSCAEEALREVNDARLRVVSLPCSAGACEARNAGVIQARGEWIAFLDDDDEWLPSKLEKQLRAAESSAFANPAVYSRFIAQTPAGKYLWPRRTPVLGEAVGDYLFARRSAFNGEAFLSTITLFARRRLLLEVPFLKSLHRHQEADWILRAATRPDVGIEFLPEALAVAHAEEHRAAISNTDDWRKSLAWIQKCRPLLSKKAYAGFVLTSLSSVAARQADWQAFLPLLKEGIQNGSPTVLHFFLYLTTWLMPQTTRRRLRAMLVWRPS